MDTIYPLVGKGLQIMAWSIFQASIYSIKLSYNANTNPTSSTTQDSLYTAPCAVYYLTSSNALVYMDEEI